MKIERIQKLNNYKIIKLNNYQILNLFQQKEEDHNNNQDKEMVKVNF